MSQDKEPATLKLWRVTDIHGNPENIEAHFMFRDEGGLTFRFKDATVSKVVAAYSHTGYVSCILVSEKPASNPPAPTNTRPDRSHRQRGRQMHPVDEEIPF